MQNLKIFGKIIAYLRKQLKKTAFQNISWGKKDMTKQLCIYVVNLNKNHKLQKINCEKSTSFADFRQS